jgi:hypothetical protein
MTSNLGGESFGRGSFGLNRGDGSIDPEMHFTDEVRAFVRPELFNRIDRVVPFLPLSSEVILQIARREVELVKRRDGMRLRGLKLEVSPAAIAHLAAMGYDVRYGARPLKRAIERELLAPLAEAVNGYPAEIRLEAFTDAVAGKLSVNVRAVPQAKSLTVIGDPPDVLAELCSSFRRDVQKCQRCSAMLTVTNQLFMLEQEQKRQEARRKRQQKPVYNIERAARIKICRAIVDELASVLGSIGAIEDEALLYFYDSEPPNGPPRVADMRTFEARLDAILLQLLAMQIAQPHRACMVLLGDRERVLDLGRAYYELGLKNEYRLEMCWYAPYGREQFRRHRIDHVDQFLESPDDSLVGVGMQFAGNYASPRFSPEAGVHLFSNDGKNTRCVVEATDEHLNAYVPPPRHQWPEDIAPAHARRLYDIPGEFVRDRTLKTEWSWTRGKIQSTIIQAVEQQLHLAARAVMEI